MSRFDELLEELRQEVHETRSQSIKSDHTVRNLVADIKAIAKKQSTYESRMWANSMGAYSLFALLSFAGLFLFFRASADRASLDRELVAREIEALEARINELSDDAQRRRQSEAEAYGFYELLASGSRDEIIERFPTVQGRLIDRATIELFRREVERIRHELALENFHTGLDAYRNQQWEGARDALQRSWSYVEVAPYSAELHAALGDTLYELDDFAACIPHLEIALAARTLPRNQVSTLSYRRAEALRRLDRNVEALAAFREFVSQFESHNWVSSARSRIATLERRIGD